MACLVCCRAGTLSQPQCNSNHSTRYNSSRQQPQQVSPLSNRRWGLLNPKDSHLPMALRFKCRSAPKRITLLSRTRFRKRKSSSASPGTHLAATPALTLGSSQTTSPSSSDELLERKGSQAGALDGQTGSSPSCTSLCHNCRQASTAVGPGNGENVSSKDGGADTKPNLSLLQPTSRRTALSDVWDLADYRRAVDDGFLNMQFGVRARWAWSGHSSRWTLPQWRRLTHARSSGQTSPTKTTTRLPSMDRRRLHRCTTLTQTRIWSTPLRSRGGLPSVMLSGRMRSTR